MDNISWAITIAVISFFIIAGFGTMPIWLKPLIEKRKERKIFPTVNHLQSQGIKKLLSVEEVEEMVANWASLMGPSNTKEELTRHIEDQLARGIYSPVDQQKLADWINKYWARNRELVRR